MKMSIKIIRVIRSANIKQMKMSCIRLDAITDLFERCKVIFGENISIKKTRNTSF